MINTYNETSLHRVLKNIYAVKTDGQTEVKIGNFIFDIAEPDGNVIEIQTANISALLAKTDFILQSGKKMKIVHPIVEKKYIVTVDENSRILSKKASPKTAIFFDSLRGLTKMCLFLKNENFSLELVYVQIVEIRQKVKEPSQIQNKSRRHLKNWIPKEKKLETILRTVTLKKDDYTKILLPPSLPHFFTVKDLQKAIFQWNIFENFSTATKKRAAGFSSLAIWILKGAGFIKEVDKNEIKKSEKTSENSMVNKTTRGKIYSIGE